MLEEDAGLGEDLVLECCQDQPGSVPRPHDGWQYMQSIYMYIHVHVLCCFALLFV